MFLRQAGFRNQSGCNLRFCGALQVVDVADVDLNVRLTRSNVHKRDPCSIRLATEIYTAPAAPSYSWYDPGGRVYE